MEAPKCKLCGNRHYGLCADTARREPAPVVQEAPSPIQSPPDIQPKRQPQQKGQSVPTLYALIRADDPGIVKLGRTMRWNTRRAAYGNSHEYAIYSLTAPTDLPLLESLCLTAMGKDPCRGYEWFAGSLQDGQAAIERVLSLGQIPYTLEHGTYEGRERFDRTTYQREYMRKRRAEGQAPKRDRKLYMQHYRAVKKGMAEPAPQKPPFDKAAYMRDYTPRWRAARKAKATPQ